MPEHLICLLIVRLSSVALLNGGRLYFEQN